MKKRIRLIAAFSIFAVAVLIARIARSVDAPKLPGSEPYTATRLEWLAMEMNSVLGHTVNSDLPFNLTFLPIEGRDAIRISVRYGAHVPAGELQSVVKSARDTMEVTARAHGWDTWLKIEEDVKPFEHNAN
jgi:hypothetical protein